MARQPAPTLTDVFRMDGAQELFAIRRRHR